MILLPSWRWTHRITASPLIAVPPLLIYLMVMVPIFPQFWAAVSAPDLDALREVLSTAHGAAAVWAQLIAFDLFIGRWIYRDSRDRGISPWLISPILLLTIFLSPIGLLGYLAIRAVASVAGRRTPLSVARCGQRPSRRRSRSATAALSPTGRTRRQAQGAPDRSADARWRRGFRPSRQHRPASTDRRRRPPRATSVVATAVGQCLVVQSRIESGDRRIGGQHRPGDRCHQQYPVGLPEPTSAR